MSFAPFYPFIHRLLKPTFPHCLWSGCTNSPTIALTFDDGPHPQHTPQLLEVLDRHRIPVSFFWLGRSVEESPDLARQITQRQHGVGLHGYNHRSFATLTSTELEQDLERTRTIIARACSIDPATLVDVRPPYGLFTPQTLKLLNSWGYRTVMWSVIPEDWTCPGAAVVVQRILDHVQNGSIIVLHDGDHGGQDVAETVDRLVSSLLQNGYQFATVDQLWSALPCL
jgi:peptidoglycan/xylan/chitin deacetylase (PgdA/CDA1 family)